MMAPNNMLLSSFFMMAHLVLRTGRAQEPVVHAPTETKNIGDGPQLFFDTGFAAEL